MIKNFTIATITALTLSACGGGGGGTTPAEVKTLKLTVGSTTIDSASHLSRVTSTITDASKNVSIVKINKEGTISLSGEDSTLFELTDVAGGKQLSFLTKPEASSPTDADQDGVYEVDIKAQDNDDQTATYKAAYKIIIPRSTLDILNGNTYYIDFGDNKYTKVTYDDSSFTAKDYRNTEFVQGSEETIPVTYNENDFTFVDEGENITCIVHESTSLTLTCTSPIHPEDLNLTYLDTAPEFVYPTSYTLTAITANTNNHTDAFTPKIASFSVTGNAPSENDKVIISKSKLGGKFSYSVTLDDVYSAKESYSALLTEEMKFEGTQGIKTNYEITTNKTLTYNCIFDKENGTNQGINYTCVGVHVINTQGNADTNFGIGVCDKEVNATDAKCSIATVPVLFID